MERKQRMALSTPQLLDGQRVLRVPGVRIASASGIAESGGSSKGSAMDIGKNGRNSGRDEVRLRVGSINLGSLTGKGGELVRILEDRKISIACVQETRWKGSRARELGLGYKVLYCGEESGRNGVGVVVNGLLKDSVVDVKRSNSRLMLVKLVWKGIVLNVVSAYAPQVGLEEEEKQKVWKDFDELVGLVDKKERLIIGGDLNGHVGERCGRYREVHGDNGFGLLSKEGEKILETAVAHNIFIVNTKFKKSTEHLITYKSRVGVSQIDFFLVRREDLSECKNCKVLPGDSLEGHHRLLVLDLEMTTKRCQRKRVLAEGIKWRKLRERESLLKEKLLEEVDWEWDGSVEDMWKRVSVVIKKGCREVLGVYKVGSGFMKKETWWWNAEVGEVVGEKKKAYKKWQASGLQEDLDDYNNAKKAAKRKVAQAKSVKYKDMYDRLETREGEKEVYRLAKARARKRQDIERVKCVKSDRGEVLVEDGEITKRWGQYFSEIMNGDSVEVDLDNGGLSGEDGSEQVQEILCVEVEKALRKMKMGKAVGADEIPIEIWRMLGYEAVVWLTKVFNRMLKGDKMPDEWRVSHLVPIYKGKGDVQECKNYRGIKLLSHTMKLWERVVDARLRNSTKVNENQFGFMPGKSTMEPIFIVRQLMEKYRETKKSMYVVFVDLEKAYDKVPRELLWEVLERKGVSKVYIEVIKDMYKDSRTRVRTVGGLSESFGVNVGVHQGSALSPYLFVLVMDELLKGNVKDVPWCMLFADDMILMGDTVEEVQLMLERVTNALELKGMKVNRAKTECMFCDFAGRGDVGGVKIQDSTINRVTSYRYLGSQVAEDGGVETEIKARIQAGWNKWREVSGVLCDKRISRRVRGKVYASVVRPVLLYGAECWPVTKKQEHMMGVAEMKMLRMMYGVTLKDRVENDYIRDSMRVHCVEQKMRESRLRWFGHVSRKPRDDLVSRVRDMEMGSRRGRGKPKMRWDSVLKKDMEYCGIKKEMVQDRDEWRRVIKMPTLAQLGQRQGR